MLRARHFLVAFTKCCDQKSSSLFSSSWYIIRSFSREDTNMSGKSLPKWIQPEGTGELKLYNSLTREKVRIFLFHLFFPSLVQCGLMQYLLAGSVHFTGQPITLIYVSTPTPRSVLSYKGKYYNA